MGFLEETLADVCHHLLVLSYLGGNADECAEFWGQVNVLALLSYFKKGLINGMNFDVVRGVEIVDHICTRLFVAVVEDVIVGVHVPFDLVYLVGAMGSVLGHDDGSFKFSVDECLIVPLEAVLD